MEITPITFTGIKAIRIKPDYKKNLDKPYLYNEILDITRKMKVPVTFYSNKIEMPSPTQSVLAKLKELGIYYMKIR